MTREEGKVFGDRQASWSLKTTLETIRGLQDFRWSRTYFKNPIRRLLNSELCRSRVIQSHSEKQASSTSYGSAKVYCGNFTVSGGEEGLAVDVFLDAFHLSSRRWIRARMIALVCSGWEAMMRTQLMMACKKMPTMVDFQCWKGWSVVGRFFSWSTRGGQTGPRSHKLGRDGWLHFHANST